MTVQGIQTADGVLSGVIAPTPGLAAAVMGGPGVIYMGAALSSQSAALAAPVTMTNATQYYDGPSITVGPGTWALTAEVLVNASLTNHVFTVKLWDGTNAALASGSVVSQGNVGLYQVGVPWVVVTVFAATTYKISAKSSGTGDSISASGPGEGNTASIITAVRIA